MTVCAKANWCLPKQHMTTSLVPNTMHFQRVRLKLYLVIIKSICVKGKTLNYTIKIFLKHTWNSCSLSLRFFLKSEFFFGDGTLNPSTNLKRFVWKLLTQEKLPYAFFSFLIHKLSMYLSPVTKLTSVWRYLRLGYMEHVSCRKKNCREHTSLRPHNKCLLTLL